MTWPSNAPPWPSSGDPGTLAARYTDRPMFLIGPALFPEWRRLVTTLIGILVPIVAIVAGASSLVGESTIGQAIVSALGAGAQVAVQTAFWVTLVFAAIERTTGIAGITTNPKDWKVDDLPELPDDGRVSPVEFGFTLAFDILVILGLLWVQFAEPIAIEGTAYPLFDPSLWSPWLLWFLLVFVGEALFAIALFVRGRWSMPMAVINAVLGAAFAIPAIYLLANALLLDPGLVDAITSTTGTEWLEITTWVTALVIALVVFFDAYDGFMKARRAGSLAAR